jgi:uncharacterized SAM-binding protein YcdF (DUF218 family)
MFLVKKIVILFFSPLSLCLGILILGLCCLWSSRRRRLGQWLVTLGTLLLLLMSLPFIASRLLTPLEYRYPPLLNPETLSRGPAGSTPPKWIVVLGGSHVSDPRLPANSQISAAALERVVEGVRLQKAIPGSKLLLSGGTVFDPVPEAEVMARIAGLLGVEPQDIMQETYSRDTADEAAVIAKIIGRGPCILVTSAAHMPRAMALFHKRGLKPIPAPTDYLVKETQAPAPDRFFPGAGSLRQVQGAVHEYLGLLWAWLRGLI